jgi:hypothetical protein
MSNTYISSLSASSFRPSSWGNIYGSGTKKWDGTECGTGGTGRGTSELGYEIKRETGHRKDCRNGRDSVGESGSGENDGDGKDNGMDREENGKDKEDSGMNSEDNGSE